MNMKSIISKLFKFFITSGKRISKAHHIITDFNGFDIVSANAGGRSTVTSGFYPSMSGKQFYQTKTDSAPLFLKTIYQNSQSDGKGDFVVLTNLESGENTSRPVRPTPLVLEESKVSVKGLPVILFIKSLIKLIITSF